MRVFLDNCIIVLYSATMITIDLSTSIPVVDQLVSTLKDAIMTGAVSPGHTLPSARQLGGDLGIHWNTVARAYRELAAFGLVYVVRGRRVVVRPRSHWARMAHDQVRAEAFTHLHEAVVRARVAGMNGEELRAALDRELAAFGERRLS